MHGCTQEYMYATLVVKDIICPVSTYCSLSYTPSTYSRMSPSSPSPPPWYSHQQHHLHQQQYMHSPAQPRHNFPMPPTYHSAPHRVLLPSPRPSSPLRSGLVFSATRIAPHNKLSYVHSRVHVCSEENDFRLDTPVTPFPVQANNRSLAQCGRP